MRFRVLLSAEVRQVELVRPGHRHFQRGRDADEREQEPDSDDENRRLESVYADGWYASITGDMFG